VIALANRDRVALLIVGVAGILVLGATVVGAVYVYKSNVGWGVRGLLLLWTLVIVGAFGGALASSD